MVPKQWPSLAVCPRGSEDPGGDAHRTVVWVRGEHDHATCAHLTTTLDRAARLDDSDIIVDLGGVTFMDASTIDAIVDAHNRLRARSRSLSLRSPTSLARRLLDVCDLAFLIDQHSAQPHRAPALGSWVTVPAMDPASDSTKPPVTERAPSRGPAPPAPDRVESAWSVEQHRTLP